MKYVLSIILLMSSITSWAGRELCTQSQLDRGCHTRQVGWSCHHECIPRYNCVCPKTNEMTIAADSETKAKIEFLLLQEAELKCCQSWGRTCCGPRCLCD